MFKVISLVLQLKLAFFSKHFLLQNIGSYQLLDNFDTVWLISFFKGFIFLKCTKFLSAYVKIGAIFFIRALIGKNIENELKQDWKWIQSMTANSKNVFPIHKNKAKQVKTWYNYIKLLHRFFKQVQTCLMYELHHFFQDTFKLVYDTLQSIQTIVSLIQNWLEVLQDLDCQVKDCKGQASQSKILKKYWKNTEKNDKSPEISSSSLGSPSEKNGASPRLSSLSDNKTTDLPIMPFGTRFFNFEIKFKSRRTFITLGLACALFSRSTKSLCQSSAALGRKKFNHLCTLCCKCLGSFAVLWCKMPMFWRAGMREGGKPLPLAFQYLIFMV